MSSCNVLISELYRCLKVGFVILLFSGWLYIRIYRTDMLLNVKLFKAALKCRLPQISSHPGPDVAKRAGATLPTGRDGGIITSVYLFPCLFLLNVTWSGDDSSQLNCMAPAPPPPSITADRQTAGTKFKTGNESFAVNGEGIV